MVFLEKFYSLLLLGHLFVTFVLVGSMTHGLLTVISYHRGAVMILTAIICLRYMLYHEFEKWGVFALMDLE
jgi:hypothetical protein